MTPAPPSLSGAPLAVQLPERLFLQVLKVRGLNPKGNALGGGL